MKNRIYLLPETGNFYKANLHSHTIVSDGRLKPEESKEIYKQHGYQVLIQSLSMKEKEKREEYVLSGDMVILIISISIWKT